MPSELTVSNNIINIENIHITNTTYTTVKAFINIDSFFSQTKVCNSFLYFDIKSDI